MRFRVFPVLLSLLALGSCGFFGTDGEPGITIPDGFSIEVAAGPPLVERPMIIDMDDEGRLYVAESSGSNDDVQQQLAERPHSILRLEDVDGDGRYDRRTVFADRMMFPEGVLWHAGSVYVAAPPSIWKLTDTDSDGVADERVEWFDAKTLTSCANDLHGPYLGLDGWIYWTKGAFAEQVYERPGREPFVTRAAHVFRRRVEGGPVEPVLTGGMDNPVEVAFTPEGERLLTSTFLQHPQLGRRDGILHAVYGGVYGKEHGVTDDHPMTGGYLPVMTHMGGAAPVGLARYESAGFGADYRGSLFATSFNLRKVTAHRLKPKGASFATEDADFLVSDDRDFHPTDVMEAPDGSLLVVDTGGWYKLCCPTAQLTKPDVLGAIYRVRKVGAVAPDDPLGAQLNWRGMEPDALVGLLDSDRPAVRKKAIAALASKGAVYALRRALAEGPSDDARRNAVWALTRIQTDAARAAVREALADPSPSVRQAALHSIAVHRDSGAGPAVAEQLDDPSDAIKRVAAEALGRLGDSGAVGSILAATAKAEDETLMHSLVFALIEIAAPSPTRRGLSAASPRTQRAAMIALDQMRPRSLPPYEVLSRLSAEEPSVAEAAAWIAARHPEWGGHLAGYLQQRLARPAGDGSSELEAQIQTFVGSREVQALLARTAGGHGPLPARGIALAVMAAAPLEQPPSGWSAAIAAALEGKETLEAALRAARALPRPENGDPVLDGALLAIARDPALASEVRIKALEGALLSLDGLDAESFRLAIGQVPSSAPVEARAAAARVLAGVPLERQQLLELAGRLPDASPMELPVLVKAFGQAGDLELGEAFLDGLSRAKGLANLRADILETVGLVYPASVREDLDDLLAGEVSGLAQQSQQLDALLATLGDGDIRRGQQVFNSSETACLACHSIGYQGGEIGPDLTSIGRIRTRKDLLEAIVYPSASFVRSYEPIVVQTAAESFSGVALTETDTHLLLATNADEQVRVFRSEIEEVRPGTVSVMPSGLDEQLTREELADLLAFLEATQWGPPGSGR